MLPERPALRCGVRCSTLVAPAAGGHYNHVAGGIPMVIKRIGVLKLAIFQGAMMAAFGVFAALIVMMFGAMLGSANHQAGEFGMVGGIAALIFLPIMCGV